jgi:hypothetical protein
MTGAISLSRRQVTTGDRATTSYPSNPTTSPVHRDSKIVTQVAIPAYRGFDSGTLLALR